MSKKRANESKNGFTNAELRALREYEEQTLTTQTPSAPLWVRAQSLIQALNDGIKGENFDEAMSLISGYSPREVAEYSSN
ncbi:MAG: hypothetical protein V4485_00240 [Pseudomonadota bacterium]